MGTFERRGEVFADMVIPTAKEAPWPRALDQARAMEADSMRLHGLTCSIAESLQ